ncbi:type III secretion system inner membrane ring subunit SctD [Yersinia kristensenii]|uniref:type III secretion system inner membrane ring subunit SctD n=1 Tax=Yersinia kristensenii TaxID=28152 RepID=UPI0005E4F33C|nr:type III secretion system inner membrane ring subunit SctD [Yersinia kristensenii]MDA5474988.1 type III secretion system inner membrane ring subunit SctD [Yersinia kristensenii]MDA5475434.1 type III secretion system inner membrane ring subunit SctD [Yersinia kristensenii]MDA5505973.1 type III secretion system inner membrane ring subunit SctD [Yersinia kristensenii]MDA5521497.1 type III secretion system inner membrane ring subunit SctD [Yersinia kristensenii]MDR4899227.1 type III secretion s
MEMKFKLRILDGELNGRELMLPKGVFTLGDQGSDVLLPLPQGKILALIISENQIMLQVSGAVWVNGLRHDLQQPVPLRQVIEAAGLALVLGEENDVLSGIIVGHRSGSRLLLWLSVATFILLGLLFSFIFWFTQQSNRLFSHLPSSIPTQLSEQLKISTLEGINATWLADGSVVLSGHCTSSSAVIQLQNFLVSNHVVFRNQLVCDDRLIASVSEVLHQYGYQDIDVKVGKITGNVAIHGAIEMGEKWLSVQKVLATIVGLKGWVVINSHDGQIPLLVERLKDLGLLSYLSMTQSNKEIVISGMLSPEQQQHLRLMLATLTQQPDVFPVRYQNIPASDQATQLLPAAIVSYGGNSHSKFVQLANGVRLQQGTVLGNGYKVILIGEQSISLLKSSNLVQIPMNF